MRVCLFEDHWEQLEPLSCLRPVFDLICGVTSLGEKQRRCLGASDWGMCVRPTLAPLLRRHYPNIPVNEYGWLLSAPVMLVNGRWLPPAAVVTLPEGPCVGMAEDQVAFAVLDEELLHEVSFPNLAGLLRNWQHTLSQIDAGGQLIDYPWQLVDANPAALRDDYSLSPWRCIPSQATPMAVVGSADNLWIAPTARVEPLVVADCTHGPVIIAEHATVTAFTRLEGPCYVGPHTHVLGAKIRGGTTLGPHCRIGGEVEASIIHGYSNKYHEGFLGHSYVGEWVNLGAGTHNSDLRNDYGPVSVPMPGRIVSTGSSKVGCFIGDHTKTGLGTLLNTGSHLGIFSNVLPAGRLAPKYIPAFTTWWNGQVREEFPLEQLLQTARRVMQRRGQELTAEHIELIQTVHVTTAEERRAALQDIESRTWRRSA